MYQFIKRLFWKREARYEAAHTAITDRWETLNLRRFYDIKNLPDPDGDMLKQSDYDLQLVAILSGVPVDQLESMPVAEFQLLQSRVAWIKNKPMPDVEERRRYVIDGPLGVRVFDACLDVRKWNTAQYIDYQQLGGLTETPEDVAALLCCYLVPAGHAYGDGYDFDELKRWFVDHFPALDAFALHNFFVVRSLRSITSTKTYWVLIKAAKAKGKQRTMRKLLRTVEDLAKNGGGSVSSTLFPKLRGLPGNRRFFWELSKLSTPWLT